MRTRNLILLLLVSSVPAFTQAVVPNDGIHIDLSAAYSFVNSAPSVNGSDSVSATVVTARLPITDRFAVRYELINIPPSNAQIHLGEVEYRRSFADFLSKVKNLRIDPSKYEAFGYGGFGGKTQENGQRAPGLSYIVGGGLDYKISDTVAVRAVDIAYVRSSLDQHGLVLSNHFQFAPGISLRF